MGHDARLAPEQLRALAALKGVPGIEAFHLAGGSAVALHLGHRRSLDLDLFSDTASLDALDAFRTGATQSLPDVRVLAETETSLRMIVAGVPVDAVRYPYPLLDPTMPGPSGFPVAGLRDLAVMKLAAIARRGIRRDFWDLSVIMDAGLSLDRVAEAYQQRYGLGRADLYHVARALVWFEDANRDPVFPLGLSLQAWDDIQARFRREAPRLLDRG